MAQYFCGDAFHSSMGKNLTDFRVIFSSVERIIATVINKKQYFLALFGVFDFLWRALYRFFYHDFFLGGYKQMTKEDA